ncbi:MAG: hypothetical protein AB7V36_03300 [Bacteroidales bacterium]
MYCPKCKAENFSKDGTVNGRSQYSCSVCGFNVTIPVILESENADKKREALILYFAGYDIEDIVLLAGLEQEDVTRLITGFAK